MRPGRRSPGIEVFWPITRVIGGFRDASMRPGRRSPGINRFKAMRHQSGGVVGFNEAGATKPRNSDISRLSGLRGHGASMRPGRRSPGIRNSDRRAWCHSGSFNEAGATKPRNSGGKGCVGRGHRCFNEAGATKPRNSASFGMRRARSRSFNEAGATKPRNCRTGTADGSTSQCRFNEAGATKPRNSRA